MSSNKAIDNLVANKGLCDREVRIASETLIKSYKEAEINPTEDNWNKVFNDITKVFMKMLEYSQLKTGFSEQEGIDYNILHSNLIEINKDAAQQAP